MEKINLTPNDLSNLKELFAENYLILKQAKEYDRKTLKKDVKLLLKEIIISHEQNLLAIMKILDEKERII